MNEPMRLNKRLIELIHCSRSEAEKYIEGGWVLATPKALAALTEAELELMDVLARHLVGDWGDIGEEERLLNDLAVVHGQRITSAYQLPTGQEIWVVTASHRDMTWLKFPEQADPE